MKIYCDGYTLGKNPSNIGGGYTILSESNQLLYHEQILKTNFTSNEAELLACVHALEIAGIGDTVSTDSMNTIYWIRGAWRKRGARSDLYEIKKKGLEITKAKQINLIQEPREVNLAGIYNEFILKV